MNKYNDIIFREEGIIQRTNMSVCNVLCVRSTVNIVALEWSE